MRYVTTRRRLGLSLAPTTDGYGFFPALNTLVYLSESKRVMYDTVTRISEGPMCITMESFSPACHPVWGKYIHRLKLVFHSEFFLHMYATIV